MSEVRAQVKVLIVEDSPSQAAVISELVKQSGYAPAVYNEIPGGITPILGREQPELVLLDLRLLDAKGNPAADGFQVCREIKRFSPKLPVIVITAEGDDDACEWALLQGADAFVQKPFAAGDLKELMLRVLTENAAK